MSENHNWQLSSKVPGTQREQSWVQRHPLPAFFLLAYAFSWTVQVPLALQASGVLASQIPFRLHYLSGYGPLLAALVVTAIVAGRQGLQEFLAQALRWRVGIGWWAFSLSPLLALAVVSIGLALDGGIGYSLQDLGRIEYIPNMRLLAPLFWFATFGLGEEIGWRGFALPRLQQGRSALRATIILWMFWALWHLPLFFYMYSFRILVGWLIGLLAGAIMLTWLYNSTSGSVFMTALWHGMFNTATACTRCKSGLPAAVISTLVILGSVLVVVITKPESLSSRGRTLGIGTK